MIRVRDMEFATVAECAAHFRVSQNHVRLFSRLGKLDRLGLRPNGKGGRKADPESRMRVVVRGIEFQDVESCARHFNCSKGAVYSALHNGNIDRLGMGFGPRKGSKNPHRSKPIKLGSLTFESRTAASLALGMNRDYVSRALNGCPGYSMERLMAAAMELTARETRERIEADRLRSLQLLKGAA